MKLGKVLLAWRCHKELTLKEVAASIGTSTATLSRIERDENMDGETLGKILCWLVKSN